MVDLREPLAFTGRLARGELGQDVAFRLSLTPSGALVFDLDSLPFDRDTAWLPCRKGAASTAVLVADGADRTHLSRKPGDVGRPFLCGGSITYLPAFCLTFIAQALLRTAINAILRLKGETAMTRLKTWTKTTLRNVPRVAADLGLNFTTAVIATIDGPGGHRRGRPRLWA